MLRFPFFRIAMDFIKDIRVCAECAETGLCTEIDGPATVLDARKIGGVGVLEDPSAERDKAWLFLVF